MFFNDLDKNVYYQGRCGAMFFKWLHKRYENDFSLTFFALQGDQDVGHAYSGPGANILTHQDVLPQRPCQHPGLSDVSDHMAACHNRE